MTSSAYTAQLHKQDLDLFSFFLFASVSSHVDVPAERDAYTIGSWPMSSNTEQLWFPPSDVGNWAANDFDPS